MFEQESRRRALRGDGMKSKFETDPGWNTWATDSQLRVRQSSHGMSEAACTTETVGALCKGAVYECS
ncbi:unnamed protein product [Lampetra planeri]